MKRSAESYARAAYEESRERIDLVVPANHRVDRTVDIAVVCPDDGNQVAYKGRCPKCQGPVVHPDYRKREPRPGPITFAPLAIIESAAYQPP